MIDEGYIKYSCHWIKEKPINSQNLIQINLWRNRLYQLGLIGEYENGVGFGNLSIRVKNSIEFIITGTHTGNIDILSEEHFTRVTELNWDKNFVTCVGPIQASSESLTHGAIYVANSEVNAIIHVHNRKMWENLLNKIPTTNKNCPYGTPEMARELIRLSQENELKKLKILVMSGHEEGIISVGKDLDEAGNILLDYYNLLEG
jgi:ribulose-5-phosphate 4-epimerase/fuculose-1-phosphate aldolase